jgi:hypothetical protein
MVLYGIGVGLAYPAVTALMVSLAGVRRAALGAGILFMVELVTGGLATAVATSVIASAADLEAGVQASFVAVAVLAGLGAALALRATPGRGAQPFAHRRVGE